MLERAREILMFVIRTGTKKKELGHGLHSPCLQLPRKVSLKTQRTMNVNINGGLFPSKTFINAHRVHINKRQKIEKDPKTCALS